MTLTAKKSPLPKALILISLLCAVLTLLACGGGGGGSGGTGAATSSGGTIYGQITASSILLQKLPQASIRAQQNTVSRALVWIEGFPEQTTLTDANGKFTLTNVPLNTPHRVIARYDVGVSNELYLARSAPITLDSSTPIKDLSAVQLEKGLYSVSGILKNQLGMPVSNARLTLWGIKFLTNSKGEFTSPPLPESAKDEEIKIEAVGYRQIAISLPFIHSEDAFTKIEITLSDLNEPNYSPIPYFNQPPSQISPGQRIELTLNVVDPDELSTKQFTPTWTCDSGKIETTANPLSIYWTAPNSAGLATISAKVVDSRGAAGIANLGIAVGGDKTAVLRITSITPEAALPESQITITGSGFGDDKTKIKVSFNGKEASIISCADKEIVLTVPSEANTGILLITSPHGEKSAGIFTVLDAGFTIAPEYGPPGTIVEIAGIGFGKEQGQSKILLNGYEAQIQSWSDKAVQISVPDGTTKGIISLLTPEREKSLGMFKVTRLFSITPTKATTGTTLTITGEGWGATQNSNKLTFSGNKTANVTSWSEDRISITVPQGAITGNLTASIQGINFPLASITIASVYQASPTKAIAGDIISITGTGFGSAQNNNQIAINGVSAQVQEWSENLIKAKIASGTRPGNLIININGLETNPVQITVSEILSISAERRPNDSYITINGYGFGQSTGFVLFGDATSSDFTIWQDDKIRVKVPGNATGTTSVRVSIMGVRTRTLPFAVTYFDQIDNSEGWKGREITITGNNFGPAQTDSDYVTFNSIKAPIISWSNTEIHTRIPISATSGPMVLTISSWPIILEEDFTVYDSYDYMQLSPDWSGPRANSKPLLPGVAEDAAGNVFATDFDNGWVWKIATDGSQTKFGNLKNPWGLAISPGDGNLYVADSGNNQIKVFDTNGNLITTIGSTGNADGQFSTPRGLCFDSSARLYVADTGNNRIQVFSPGSPGSPYSHLATFGAYGNNNGEFISPSRPYSKQRTNNLCS